MNKQISEHAAAAKAIRAELKKAFPTVKFSVRSECFSMGDAVRISYTDGPTTKEVQTIVGKYQYGTFNGMEDIYENDNMVEGLPQTKYVQVSRDSSPEMKRKIAEMLGVDSSDQFARHQCGEYVSTMIHREFCKMSFA